MREQKNGTDHIKSSDFRDGANKLTLVQLIKEVVQGGDFVFVALLSF